MATNNITSIKDYFNRHSGLQRNNRFDVSFTGFAGGLYTKVKDYIDSEQFYPVEQANIGNRAIEGVSDNLGGFGFGRIQPRAQVFAGAIQLSFAITNDNHILKFFNAWFNYLYSGGRVATDGTDLKQKYNVPWYNDAVFPVSMKIRLLDPNGNPNSTFTFYEVMPVEMQPFEVNMNVPNKYMNLIVMISYKEFIQT